jgi:hypothetical protein
MEFQVSLGHTARACLKIKKQKKKEVFLGRRKQLVQRPCSRRNMVPESQCVWS